MLVSSVTLEVLAGGDWDSSSLCVDSAWNMINTQKVFIWWGFQNTVMVSTA